MEENNNLNPEAVTRDTNENQELARCKQQYAYLQADFDNYRKRMEAQRGQWSQAAQADVLTQLIDIVDDFDRAQNDISNPAFELIYKAFKKVLARFNATEITENTEFNPNLHEAIMQTPLVDGAVSGQVAQVLQKGYRMGTTILRPAKVAVYE
jgi:molecular chaperone GrpE